MSCSLESIMLHCYVAASSKFIWTAVHAVALSPWWLARKASQLTCWKVRHPCAVILCRAGYCSDAVFEFKSCWPELT
jgi:hypothetical protein